MFWLLLTTRKRNEKEATNRSRPYSLTYHLHTYRDQKNKTMPTKIKGITLYSLAEIAEALEVTLQTVRNEIGRGKLRSYKAGLGVFIEEEDFRAYLQGKLQKTALPSESLHSEGRK